MKSNFRRFAALSLASILTLQSISPIFAYQAGTSGSSGSSSSSGGGDYSSSTPSYPPSSSDTPVSGIVPETSGGSGGGDSFIGNGCYCDCDCDKYEEYTVYTPKVTILHNVNALIAHNDKKSVYYIPTLDDLPFNLGDTALSIKEKDGTEHRFALVYDGMFDSEAAYSTGKSTETTDNSKGKNYSVFHTSKDLVNDADTGSLAVNTIGTDILLTNEKFTVKNSNGTNIFDYTPSIAGTADLTGSQVVMDLYKALGVFEYRVQYSYSQDENWDTNSSPILQELDFLTSKYGGTDGFDISESRCDVSVSRTYPAYYWERFKKDGVNVGKQYTDTIDISNIAHIDAALNKSTSVSLSQFINCAVALMNLYGEAAVTADEIEHFDKAYPMLMATSGELSELERNSLKYLIIKGIISEDELVNANWRAPVHLLTAGKNDGNSILQWLGRIANPDSRLSMKDPAYVPAVLEEAGYAGTTVELSDADASELVVQSIDSANTYDLLIEYVNNVTNETFVPNNRSRYVTYNYTEEFNDETYTTDQKSNKGTANTKAGADVDPDDEAIAMENITNSEDAETALQNVGMLLATGTVKLSGLSQAPSLADLTNPTSTNMYYYLGPEEFDGKYYYHFKISKQVTKSTAIKIVVPTDSSTSTLYKVANTKDDEPIKFIKETKNGKAVSSVIASEILNISGGGVIPIDKTKPVTFDSEGFDRSYLDANAFKRYKAIDPTLANDQYIYSFYIKNKENIKTYFIGKNGTSESSDKVQVRWQDMVVGDETHYKVITDDTKSLTVNCLGKVKSVTVQCRIENIKYDKKKEKDCDGYFVQILTNNKAAVEAWALLSKKMNAAKPSVYVDEQNNEAYVKSTENGTYTMVSCERLKNAGYITSYQEISEDIFVITVGAYENNVVINRKGKYIIVGNTLILPKDRDKTVLYTNDPDKGWLICLESCLGWAGSYSYVRDSSNATIITNDTLYGYDVTSQVNSLKTITQCYPKSTIKAMWTDYPEISGFNMTSTYALAPYLIVMDMSAGSSLSRQDWLFVWHRQNAVLTNGTKVKVSKAVNDFAHEQFARLLALPGQDATDIFESIDSDMYRMTAYNLSTAGGDNVNKFPKEGNEKYLKGFSYHQLKRKGIGKDDTVTSGWVYNPPKYTKLSSALNAYAKAAKRGCIVSTSSGIMSSQASVELPIPIFELNGVYYDANVNFTGMTEGDYLPVGTMAGKVVSTSSKGDILKLDDNGFYQKDTSIASADGYEVFTAPVAQFAALKQMGTASVADLKSGAIYFGTSRCRLINGKVSFGDLNSSIPSNTQAIVSYLSTGNSTVYVMSTGTSALSDILNTINTVLEYSLTDPDNLVDWTNYRMTRALAGADAWSSVALMFVIQILPRIVGLLFMLLMILSLIANWSPWQKICRNTFDVYKFLTLGHQTVDTIDLKRLFFVSLLCSILMVMIYTGTLFEFIMFVAKFFIALYQH